MSVKDVVEIVKLVQPPAPSESAKINIDVAKLFETAVAAKKETPSVDIKSIIETSVKPLMDEVKSLRQAEMLRLEREIEQLKNRPGFMDELAGKVQELKALRDAFGVGTTGPSVNVELKKAELDLERWKLEETMKHERWRDEQALARRSEAEKLKLIRDALATTLKRAEPILDAAVEEGKRRLAGGEAVAAGAAASTVAVGAGQTGFFCSNCLKSGVKTFISVEGNPESVTCPTCNFLFKRQG
jgi:hypothetical protein